MQCLYCLLRMKNTFNHSSYLPSFRCDTQSLESLVNALLAMFGGDDLRYSIDILLQGQSLGFDSFEAVRQCTVLPSEVRSFSLWISSDTDFDRSYWFLVNPTGKSYVKAEGHSIDWCTGLVGATVAFAQRHRAWYAPLQAWPLSLFFVATGFAPLLLSLLNIRILTSLLPRTLYVISLILLFYLSNKQTSIFPCGVLIIRKENNWLKRYNTEIMVVATVATAIATFLAAF
jgi:hypothetical protein